MLQPRHARPAIPTGAIVALCFSATAMAQSTTTWDLDNFRWQNRVLIVFSSAPDTPSARKLVQATQRQKDAFVDRDMMLIEVYATGFGRIGVDSLAVEDVLELRERFQVGVADFVVVLIGKDGGTKLRGGDDTTLDEVFAHIDTMPMRRREMRKNDGDFQ